MALEMSLIYIPFHHNKCSENKIKPNSGEMLIQIAMSSKAIKRFISYETT